MRRFGDRTLARQSNERSNRRSIQLLVDTDSSKLRNTPFAGILSAWLGAPPVPGTGSLSGLASSGIHRRIGGILCRDCVASGRLRRTAAARTHDSALVADDVGSAADFGGGPLSSGTCRSPALVHARCFGSLSCLGTGEAHWTGIVPSSLHRRCLRRLQSSLAYPASV